VPQHQDRTYWLQTMLKIAEPVLANLAEGRLAASLPAEGPPDRQLYAPLEAFARTLAGIAPWLESGTEDALRGRRPSAFSPIKHSARVFPFSLAASIGIMAGLSLLTCIFAAATTSERTPVLPDTRLRA